MSPLTLVSLVAWVLGLTWLFLGYFEVPNRNLPHWDAAMHFRDGYLLYQQLGMGDLASFVVQIFKFSYWLPLHPILVGLGCGVAGFSFAPAIWINFAALAAGSIVFLTELQGAFQIYRQGPRLVLHILMLALSLWLIRQGILGDYLGQMMLEVLSYSLTLAFLGSAIRAWRTRESGAYRRATLWMSALFFTKVHYGIYAFLPWVGFLTAEAWPRVKQAWAWKSWREEWKNSRALKVSFVLYLVLSTTLVFRAIGRGTLQPMHDWIWLQLFAPLVAWTFFKGKERVYRILGEPWRDLSRYWILPFGWLYLFPIKHKIATFFELSRHNGDPIPLQVRVGVLWDRLASSFLNMDGLDVVLIGGFLVITGAWIAWRSRKNRWVWGVLGFLAFFYFMMSFLSHRHEDRILFPWMAGWVALLFGVLAYSWQHLQRTWVTGTLLVSLGALGWLAAGLPELRRDLVRRWGAHYLDPSHQAIGDFTQFYRFDQPGMIYGLGMDPVVPLLDLWCRKEFPKMSSYLVSREKGLCFANDFGREGNADPVGFASGKFADSRFRQFALFEVQGHPKNPELRRMLQSFGFTLLAERSGIWQVWRRPGESPPAD